MNCPKCGSELIIKEGRYGRFLACPKYPECQYTKAMWTFSASGKQYCEKCKGTGYLPFIKDGKVVSHARVYCECYQEEPRPDHRLTPSDFDFPMSYDYRSFIEQEITGKPLPSLEDAPSSDIPTRFIEQPDWDRKQWDIVLQLQGRVLHCENKVTELLSSFKKRKRTKHFKEYV